MLKSDINFFEYIDSFKIYSNVDSKLIYGELSKKAPLISFIIPTYKCKPSVLRDALNSALNQLGFDDYEVLVIDNDPEVNCSMQQLIESYKNKKIVYYKNSENIGMFGNWNRGAELSRSNWVAYLHDDDIASPYFLKSCFRFLKDNTIAIVKPDNAKFSNSKGLDFYEPKDLKLEQLSLIDFIWGCQIGAPSNIIFNRNVILQLGGFNPNYFPSADYVFAINCAKDFKVYKIPFVLGGYRIGENESLNPTTMELFYKYRFLITSFLMKNYHFPYWLISLIQSSLMKMVINETNDHYNTNIKFDYCKELGLKKRNDVTKKVANKVYSIFRRVLNFRRKLTK